MKTIYVDGGGAVYGLGGGSWCNHLRDFTTEPGTGWQVVSPAVPNRNIVDIMYNFEALVTPYNANRGILAVILQTGMNEATIPRDAAEPQVPLKQFRKDIMAFTSLTEKQKIPTVLIGLPEVNEIVTTPCADGSTLINENVTLYDDVLRDGALRYGHSYIDTRQVYAPLGAEATLATNGFHPSILGQSLLYDQVLYALDSIAA